MHTHTHPNQAKSFNYIYYSPLALKTIALNTARFLSDSLPFSLPQSPFPSLSPPPSQPHILPGQGLMYSMRASSS